MSVLKAARREPRPDLLVVDGFRPWCLRCRRPGSTCLCAFIPRLSVRTKFVFLMHPMEAKKTKNGTGRITHLALPGSELHVGVDFRDHPRVNELIADPGRSCRLLYPARRASSDASPAPCPDADPVVFVLDGTWPCAKKMMRLSTNLHGLPRLPLEVTRPSGFVIKHQPGRFCLATVEAVDAALHALTREGVERHDAAASDALLRPFRRMIDIELAHAAAPGPKTYRASGPFKRPDQRGRDRSGSGRNITFLG